MRYCWHSIDPPIHDGVLKISYTVMPEKATITSYMNFCRNGALRLPKLHDQSSFTLHWRTFSGWGMERVTVVFAFKGGQYLIYGCLQPVTTYITLDAKPKIIDAALMLIFRIGQGACRCCFGLERQPRHHLWTSTTSRNLDYPRCKAKDCWCSMDAHFQNWAGSMSLLFLPVQAARTSFMDIYH